MWYSGSIDIDGKRQAQRHEKSDRRRDGGQPYCNAMESEPKYLAIKNDEVINKAIGNYLSK